MKIMYSIAEMMSTAYDDVLTHKENKYFNYRDPAEI